MDRKKLFPIMIFVLSCLLVFLSTKFFYETKISQLNQEIQSYKTKSADTLIPTISQNDIVLIAQKNQIMTTLKKSLLYFSSKVIKLGANKWQVTITLEGPDNAGADAVDLYLNLDNNIKIDEIQTGKAFPLYPRKVIDKNYLLISGFASIENNTISFGQPGNVFTTLIISGNTDQTQSENIPIKLTLNMEETKIYFNGETVFDTNKTIKEILLN